MGSESCFPEEGEFDMEAVLVRIGQEVAAENLQTDLRYRQKGEEEEQKEDDQEELKV